MLMFTGDVPMTIRHRTFGPGQIVLFDMDDPADAALFHKCRVLPWFTESEPVKHRGRKRRGENQA